MVDCEGAGYEGPGGFQVSFAIFGKEGCEGGFVGEGTGWVICWCERINLGDWEGMLAKGGAFGGYE